MSHFLKLTCHMGHRESIDMGIGFSDNQHATHGSSASMNPLYRIDQTGLVKLGPEYGSGPLESTRRHGRV